MAQVYRFTDENGAVRLMAEIDPSPGGGPAAGTYVPVADATGVTVDSMTYADPIRGGGAKLTTLVFSTDGGAIAIAHLGDAFPKLVVGSSMADGIIVGDGTADPYNTTGGALSYGGGLLQLGGIGGAGVSIKTLAAAFLANQPPRVDQVSPLFTITSGALPTVQLVTATGTQITTARDAETITPCTFNPGAATTATVAVALSSDNVTYSTLGVETVPAGVALDGTIHLVKVRVPAGWYLKLTVNAQATLGLTTYY